MLVCVIGPGRAGLPPAVRSRLKRPLHRRWRPGGPVLARGSERARAKTRRAQTELTASGTGLGTTVARGRQTGATGWASASRAGPGWRVPASAARPAPVRVSACCRRLELHRALAPRGPGRPRTRAPRTPPSARPRRRSSSAVPGSRAATPHCVDAGRLVGCAALILDALAPSCPHYSRSTSVRANNGVRIRLINRCRGGILPPRLGRHRDRRARLPLRLGLHRDRRKRVSCCIGLNVTSHLAQQSHTE